MLKWIIIVFIVICVLVIFEWMREIHTFKMTHYYISSKKLKGLQGEKKIVFLSDLHNYSYGKENEKLLSAIRKEEPDLILCSGDMLVGKPGVSADVAEAFMKQLPEICDVYHSNGNHEERMKAEPEKYGDVYFKYIEAIRNAGVHTLENEKVELNWDDLPVQIYGLELPHKRYKKFTNHDYNISSLSEGIGETEQKNYNILIAHNPGFMDIYLEWGADLVVSGHYHGGVVRLPGIGGFVTPSLRMFPKYSGEMTKVGDSVAVVSKGIGIHTVKVRLFNPAEVVVLHISGTEE